MGKYGLNNELQNKKLLDVAKGNNRTENKEFNLQQTDRNDRRCIGLHKKFEKCNQ